ncbi:MAG: squalene--hopene cyclase [Verrucomicrobium sp.]|nr:squalene--hopene cyclase [Verrucomicrobium sp.]
MSRSPATALQEQTKITLTQEQQTDLDQKVLHAIAQSQKHLLGLQKEDGHWRGELVVDITLTANYILYMHWMGEVDYEKQAKCVRHILKDRLPDGGWNIYPGGPAEVNATVVGYLALKLSGFTPDEPEMERARNVILRLGGIPACNTYTKLNLAILGLFPWHHLPIIPAEIILLPNWLYFNIYEMSSWSRAMVVPLSLINHYKPTRHLPEDKQLHELFPYGTEHRNFRLPWSKKVVSWQNFFLAWDVFLKFVDSLPWRPFRNAALKKAEAWLLARNQEGSDGLAAIYPAMMYTIIALKAMGYTDENSLIKRVKHEFDRLHVSDKEKNDFRIEPCFSPVWDTAITAVALAESGIPADAPELRKAAQWLLAREVRHRGDWAVKNPHPENSGWAFEYNNVYYPDVDDTFKVLLALSHIETEDEAAKKKVIDRALRWAISFQCKSGGWASFDKDVTKRWLEDVPFSDHNAILDPPCSDITCRGLELFGRLGLKRSEKFIRRAIEFVRNTQDGDGSWYGRWGVNYIYGTWLVLRGLHAIGEDMNQDWILRGRDWMESCQNPDGGWGETPASYDDPHLKGQGPSTASQTAWALMAILACGDANRASIKRGLEYLASTQQPNGEWKEELITGTGFPRVFYLRYDMYRNNWPLLALATYKKLRGEQIKKAEAWAASALSLAEYRRQRDLNLETEAA